MKKPWLLPLVVSLHNLEEAIWLPRYWVRRGWQLWSASEFRVFATLVAGLAWLITYFSLRHQERSIARRLFLGFCWVMLLNAVWHIAASLYIHSYAPGVVTAIFLVLPATSYLLLWREP